MKKIFYSSIAAVLFVCSLSLQSQEQELITNQAFADGTCCPESGSSCDLNGKTYTNRCFQEEGSCGGGGTVIAAIK